MPKLGEMAWRRDDVDDLIGQELGSYRILSQIGAGAMATVYRAYHAAMDRYVAIKVLPEQMGQDPELRERFQREVRVIAKLEHAHILPVHDFGQAGNRLYLVMRHIEAGTLKDRLRHERLGLEEVNRIVQQVGGALAHAHRLGVVHRDVKPSNVLLDAQGECYLTDFGLARVLEATSRLTATGVGMGTPAYMSPEQGLGQEIDARSDIYSLGVMLYELVTGQVPYQAETPMAVVLMHISAPLPLPRHVNPGIPGPVEAVILKAMAKNPDDRFQTVAEMMAALDAAVPLAGAKASAERAAGESAVAKEPKVQGKRRPMQGGAGLRKATQTRWGRAVLLAAVGAVVLLALFLVLSRVPFRVQIRDGRLEVVRVIEVTPTASPSVQTTATAGAQSTPSATSSPSPTSSSLPSQTPTVTPTLTPTPGPTFRGISLISYGQTISGKISMPAEKGTYTFVAQAGDVVLVGMSDDSVPFDSQVQLYGPDGALLKSDSGAAHVEFTQALADAGSHTLLVGDRTGVGTAGYTLFLQRVNGPGDALSLAYGQTVSGRIDLMAEKDAYVFDAQAEDVVLVGMSDDSVPFDSQVQLYGPDGTLLHSDSGAAHVEFTQALADAGSYTLLVGDRTGVQTAGYTLFLQRIR